MLKLIVHNRPGVAKLRLASRMRSSSQSYAALGLIYKNQNILIFLYTFIKKKNVLHRYKVTVYRLINKKKKN
jgi:hypothetical protein